MPTRNVNLTEHYDQFISDEIEAGRYRNASEVMRAGLRLLEQQRREEREKLDLLRSLASKAFQQLDQGKGIEFESKRDLTKFISAIGRRAGTIANRRRCPMKSDGP
jgi:antitoxin ParD1/3/4